MPLATKISMNHEQLHPRILLKEAFRYGRHDARIHDLRTSDREFSRCRIGQELDLLQPLTHLVENVDTAFEQRLPIIGQLDTLRGAVEQPHLERLLEIGNRL